MYKLTPTAEEYLLPESPTYYGPMIDLRMAAMPVYTFETLKNSVLSDIPQACGGRDVFCRECADSSRAQVFTRATKYGGGPLHDLFERRGRIQRRGLPMQKSQPSSKRLSEAGSLASRTIAGNSRFFRWPAPLVKRADGRR